LLMSMLAKDPKNRPANAIKLAEAAEAIRNGDIATAHAAVPGMLLFESTTGPITAPVDTATAPTGVVTSPYGKEQSSTATSALPVLGAGAAGAALGAAAASSDNALTRANALEAERQLNDEEEVIYTDDENFDDPEPERKKRSPWLGALGLQVRGEQVFDDQAAVGIVTGIDPSGAVQPGEVITVQYSKGPQAPPTVAVPTIAPGASEAQVRATLEGAGLKWIPGDPVNGAVGQQPGTFVRLSPAAGTEVNAGSTVTYFLAKNVAPTNPNTPSANPSASGNPKN
ncbi:protein kinase, partial [Paenarthrobacter sp. RAF9]